MSFSVTAFVPVKGESSRLAGKNALPFADSTLLQHKIRQLRKIPAITQVLVSSDSEHLLSLAGDEGADVLLRPKHFADESRPITEFMRYAADVVDCENLLWSCVTSPLFGEEGISLLVEQYFDGLWTTHDSILTVLPFQHYLLDDSGPLNFGRGEEHVNSEKLEKIYLFTNGGTITPTAVMREVGDRIGLRPKYFFVSQIEAVDIDYREDYELALALYGSVEGRRVRS